MNARRYFAIALVLCTSVLSGCISPLNSITTTNSPVKPEERTVEHTETRDAIGDSNDPLPRLQAFLVGQGLTSTPAKPGEAARLVATWDSHITFAPDSIHGGDPVPGIVGRLWLFGPDLKDPVEPDGELIVGLWDQSPKSSGGEPALLEVWHIDRESARKFKKIDMWGMGYSMYLPFQRYHVDLKQVSVQVRYNGADGRNLAAPPQLLALDHSATLQRAREKLGLTPGGIAQVPNQLPDLSSVPSSTLPGKGIAK